MVGFLTVGMGYIRAWAGHTPSGFFKADPLSDPSAFVTDVGSVLGPPGSDPTVTPTRSDRLWL